METTKQEREDAESVIFSLQRKIGLYLRAGDTETVNKIQQLIAHLQFIYGVTGGVSRGEKNAGIDY